MSTNYSQFSSLTLEQVDELFRKYDKNGDGVLTKEELTGIFSQLDCSTTQSKSHGSKSLPTSKTPPPKKKTDEPHARAPKEKVKDKAKGNEIETNTQKVKEPKKKHGGKSNENPLNKLPTMTCEDHKAQKATGRDMPKKEPFMRLNREHLKDIFREHDVDCDGFLDYGELTLAFHFIDPILSCYKARNAIAHADANGDGLISEDEFDKLLDYVEQYYGEDLVF